VILATRGVEPQVNRRLSAGGGGFGHFEVGGADEENVTFLLAVKSFHRMHIPDQALAFRCEAEAFQYGLDD
jgi:hypothetical protein